MEKPHTKPSRRDFIGGFGAAFATLGLATPLSAKQAATDAAGNAIPEKTISNPYIYKFSIGKFEAWSISDGFGTFTKGVNSRMWPPAERPEMSKALTALGERPDDMTLYVNILLLRKDKEVILVDAGFGPHQKATWGWLAKAMESIGITFADVTHAMLSHSHIDHIGGLASGGKILFPNAAVHVLREELDFWRAKEPDFSKSHRTDDIPKMIQNVRNSFDTKSEGESLLHISDLAHNHVLMFENPEWFIDFDHNPQVAIATRKKIFEEIAATRERIYGFHLPWPGLGVIIPNGRKGYQWVAESHRWDF